MTIVEFLTARLDEREQSAQLTIELTERIYPADEFEVRWRWARLTGHKTSGGGGQSFEPGAPTPTEVLADIAAKRAIIHQHGNGDGGHECPDGFMDSAETEPHIGYEVVCMTQRFLASVYADHPDYQQEWKP